MATTYYKKCDSKYTSIVDALVSIGVKDTSKENRVKIGKLNNITDVGTESGNKKMLDLLKKGKLIKSKTAEPPVNAQRFVNVLYVIHEMFLKFGTLFYYSYTAAETDFYKALAKVAKGIKSGVTCVVPTRWAMKILGIDPSGFYGELGKFTKFTDAMKKYLTHITTGDAIGKTVKQAVDKKLLQMGDILVFEGRTHTVTYTGNGYLVFDGGSAAESRGYNKVGIILDYSVVDKNYRISGIARWK